MRKLILILAPCLLWGVVARAQWTAEITGAEIVTLPGGDPGRRIVRTLIKFTDGTQVIDGVPFEAVNPSTTSISNFCRGKIAQYETMDTFVADPPLGNVDLTKKLPTAEELAKIKYFQDRAKLDYLTKLVADKALPPDNPEYLALLQTVKDGWRKEYFDLP